MRTGRRRAAAVLAWLFAGCGLGPPASESVWRFDEAARALVAEPGLAARIRRALDAAREAGTDPSLSGFHVRAATVVEHEGEERVVLGGNTEYALPEAIHGETSLLNHVTVLYGPETTRRVRFIAFYAERCGESLGCGDCRDYEMATTDYENLLIVCGQAVDGLVRVRPFTDALVPETAIPEAAPGAIPLDETELARLVEAAAEARRGGVTLIDATRHTGAAGLSHGGRIYRAAGADDAAFHYRYPIGGLLQQAATERDYFLRAIVVVGEPGRWPRVAYRDRQYGYEASRLNRRRGLPPLLLVLANGEGRYRAALFDDVLPHAFSTDAFRPEAVDRFLATRAAPP